MNELRGVWFEGGLSRGSPARLRWSAAAIAVITDEGQMVRVDRDKIQALSPLPGTPTRIAFGGRESFVTDDGHGVERLREALALAPGLASRVERHMPAVIAAAALVVAMLAAIALWGVPTLAGRLALTVPEEVSAQVSQALMSQLDFFLEPSGIPPPRQRELERYFQSHGEIETIVFREAGRFGANAVTLGATMIAFSDELVELAESDEELLAVYFHELGHARLRHVEQNVFRAAAWLVLITMLTGDIGAVGEMLVGLPLSAELAANSRAFEREADAYAVDRLIEAGLSPMLLADILRKLEAHHQRRGSENSAGGGDADPSAGTDSRENPVSPSLPDYLATHPPTSERIAYIRSRMND
ncbi:MAG: M48 family metallopeptidase [Gammaproteobacteria bacterium]|nr:M48 family metallopeptidase [Gammaproteobacteria bacterium]